MKTLILSIFCLLSSTFLLTAQDFYLPVSSSSETAKAAYYDACKSYDKANFMEGEKLANQAIAVDPNFFMACAMLIQYSSDEKRAKLIDQALAIDAGNFNEAEKILRGLTVKLKEDPNATVSAEMKALTVAYPTVTQAFIWAHIDAFYSKKNIDVSLAYGEKAQELSPDFAPTYNTMGYVYMAKEDMAKAKASFKKYIALLPNEANAYDSMGEYYMVNKKYAKSAKFYDKASAMGMEISAERAKEARAARKEK